MNKIPLINEISRYNGKKYPLFKCEKCGFIRPNPLPYEDHDSIKFYDEGEHIKFYDTKIKDINRKTKEYKYYYQYFIPYIELIRKYKISGKTLDVGCGPGHLVELELQKGLKAEGMEVGSFLVNLLRKRFKVHQGILGKVKLTNYNLITMNHVLEHIENPEKAIQEINKALQDKGYLIMAFPYIYGIMPQILRSKWYGLGYGQHLNFFSRKSIKKLLERNGFEVREISIKSVDYAHPKFPMILNIIARFIMKMNVFLGLGDNMFVVAQKRGKSI